MRKLIFLDIDGVLAIPNKNRRIWAIDDTKQELLKEILDSTGAEIVLSSSWRWHTVEITREKMQSQGFRFSDRITGVTIRAYQYVDKQSKIHLSIPRGVEIKQWIDTNIHSENGKNWDRKDFGKDFTYVILDDDSDMLLEQKKQFINTNSLKGLNKGHVEKAIRILNAQK